MDTKDKTPNKTPNKTIYRYDFSKNIIEIILNFSRLHMFAERKQFKESFNKWLETNEEILSVEYKRLINLGYTGDFKDKLFKATRYYFKEKQSLIPQKHRENNETPKIREYIALSYDIIYEIDKDIKKNYNKNFKPSIGYNNFIINNKNIIDKEIIRIKNLSNKSLDTKEKCLNKLKKSYKNRCYNYYNSL